MSCLCRLVLNRTTVINQLFASVQPVISPSPSSSTPTMPEGDDVKMSSGLVALEIIACIFYRDIDYCCTSADAIPIGEKDVGFDHFNTFQHVFLLFKTIVQQPMN